MQSRPIELEVGYNGRKIETIALSFITGQGNFKEFLYRLNYADSPLCDCGTEVQTPDHLLYRCHFVNAGLQLRLIEQIGGRSVINIVVKDERRAIKAFTDLIQEPFIVHTCVTK